MDDHNCYYILPLKPKQATALQLSTNLASYISSSYGQAPQDYMKELKELENVREAAVNASISAASPDMIRRYIRELQVLPLRFPIDEDNIKIAIGWYNFVSAEKPKPFACFSLRYEQAACIFNLGIMYYRLGGMSMMDKDWRRSCSLYMQAAGVFQYLRSKGLEGLNLPPLCDLTECVVHGLEEFCLGYAQECFYWKGIEDGGSKEGMLAKLAFSTAGYFHSAHKLLSSSPVIEACPEGRIISASVSAKALLFSIICELKKAAEMASLKKYGEEYSRIYHTHTSISPNLRELQVPKDLEKIIQSTLKALESNYSRAKKENDLIYHELIIPRQSLAPITPAIMVKPTLFTDLHNPQFIIGIFEGLVPLRLHQSMVRYQRAKSEKVSSISQRIDEVRQKLASSQSRIAGILESIEEPLPLQSKSRELQAHGGMKGLLSSVNLVKSLSAECQNSLDEVERQLAEEMAADDRKRSVYGKKWTRLPSKQSSKAYYEKIDQIRQTLSSASDADAVIASRLDRYGKDMGVLCEGAVPHQQLSPAGRVAVDRLKKCLLEGEAISSGLARAQSELQAVSDADYPSSQLAQANTDDKLSAVIAKELHKYDQCQLLDRLDVQAGKCIEQSIVSIDDFASVGGCSAVQRFDDAYKHYLLINKDLAEGVSFYTLLQDPLQKLKSDVSDHLTGRLLEMEELESFLSTGPIDSEHGRRQYAYGEQGTCGTKDHHDRSDMQGKNDKQDGQKQWMPGMPINYASKK